MTGDEKEKSFDEKPAEATEETGESAQNRDEGATNNCNGVIADKNEEIRKLQDRVLRTAAEMDNTRKRLEREKSEGSASPTKACCGTCCPSSTTWSGRSGTASRMPISSLFSKGYE